MNNPPYAAEYANNQPQQQPVYQAYSNTPPPPQQQPGYAQQPAQPQPQTVYAQQADYSNTTAQPQVQQQTGYVQQMDYTNQPLTAQQQPVYLAGYEQQQQIYPDSPASYPGAQPPANDQTYATKEKIYAVTTPPPEQQPAVAAATPQDVSSELPVLQPAGQAPPAPVIASSENAQHWTATNGAPQIWTTGMCDCFDDWKICCIGAWCPWMLYARTNRRIRTNPSKLGKSYSDCNSVCWMHCCCGYGWNTRQRNEIRYRYNLQGSECGDTCRHMWCASCALCQEEREVRHREKSRREIVQAQSVQQAGYQANAGMVYGK